MSSTADDDTDERAWNAAGKRHVTGSAGYMMDKMGARYKNDHGRYKPVDELDATGRSLVGNTDARLHIPLHNVYVCRQALEIACGALQRALEATHKADVEEKYRLFEVRMAMVEARAKILDLKAGTKKNSKSSKQRGIQDEGDY